MIQVSKTVYYWDRASGDYICACCICSINLLNPTIQVPVTSIFVVISST